MGSSEHIVTSREGLFLLRGKDTHMLREGMFFGIARTENRWYTFRYTGDKYTPTDTGMIESFVLDGGDVQDLRVEATGPPSSWCSPRYSP